MKTTTLLLLSLLLSTFAWAQGNELQGKIEAALGESFATQQNQLEPLLAKLKENAQADAYWIAYGQFFSSIFLQQSGQTEKAAQAVQEGIKLLENIPVKNSEEHALLGYLLGYSITFDQGAVQRISTKSGNEYQAALKKDKNNLRAYLGLGQADFYKPAAFGGGQKVEEYLLKALALPEQSIDGGPSWGKNMAYYILASYYKREGQLDKAKMYCMQGLVKYPADAQLNQLKLSL